MIEVICQGKSPSEAKAKCTVAKMILMLLTEKEISTGKTINLLNTISSINIAKSEEV